ncbi:MAG: mechanosensitive ion channel family protein [Acidimicrobiia bacterium]|nr:mechanosensitive ion channel family protein [Acidimicrobiia bacterium]
MIEFFGDPRVLWALAIVLLLPIAIIAAGETVERLRQRDSPMTRIATTVRRGTIPLIALWALATGLFGLAGSNVIVRVIATGLLMSLAALALAVLRLVIAWWRDRPDTDTDAGRGVPQLLLALPRMAVIASVGWILLDGVWGVNLSAAFTALGVTSLVVSFALQDTLSGLASGLLLLSDPPFQPGDWVKTGDLEGRVVDINWRTCRIETRNGDLVIVPNAQLADSVVTNYDRPTKLHRVVVPVQVAFSNPPTRAKAMLLDAARSTNGVLEDPAPAVHVVQIDDPLMGYEVHLWIDDYRLVPRVASDFGSLVWYQSHRHDVPLPSPAFDLYTFDGVATAEASRPSRAEVRRRLGNSPLLGPIGEDALDRLADSSSTARFQSGEVIVDRGSGGRDLFVLSEGSAAILAIGPDGEDVEIAQLSNGEVFGLLGRSDQWAYPLEVRAVEDCEVLVITEVGAGEVTSRTPALAAALNQLVTIRRRRISRVMDQITLQTAERDPAGQGADQT